MKSAPITTAETIYSGDINAMRADASGAAALSCHQQLGTLALGTNATNSQTLTLTVNGTAIVIHFVTAIGAVANNVLIGASAAATSANLLAFLQNPSLTNTTQVAATTANQTLLSYLTFSQNSTNTVIGTNNKTAYAPLTSFSCSTTVTSGTFTASTVKVYVEPGVCYVNGTEVYFAGGSSPAVTAPSVNPRIDVLTIDSTGTLAWTTGAESGSPVAPTYPVNKIPLCEIRNVVSQTIINDFENQTAAQAYILNDVRPFLQAVFTPGAVTYDIIPDADGTRNLGSLTKEFNNIYAKTNIFVNGAAAAISKFGGTGTDGAFTHSSGTTNISCSSLGYLEQNFTSISITGSANLAFTSPNNTSGTSVALKSQGAVTITTSSTHAIDMRSMGGGPGTAFVIYNVAGSGGATNGQGGSGGSSCGGQGGNSSLISAPGISSENSYLAYPGAIMPPLSPFLRYAWPGGNGASGGSGNANGFSGGSGGGGGIGGGGLYIECAGAYNFTTGAIDLSGGVGGNGTNGTGGGHGGGGGGGAGGNCLVLYTSLTADSGTYNVSGGAGGTNTISGQTGGAGTTLRMVNTFFA